MPEVKTGAEHIASLRDGRQVYLDGALVADVTTHPAFRGAVRSAARRDDLQAAAPEAMTFDIGRGRRASRAGEMPRSREAFARRREALSAWARLSAGFLGRGPDHLASSLIGQAMGIEVFERHGPARAAALRGHVAEATRQDRFVSHVIVNPQAGRSKPGGEQAAPDLATRIVDEDAGGLALRGAKMLGTSAVLANEVPVAKLQPLRAGEEHLALSCALPIDARGLKLISRTSHAAHAVSAFDDPPAARFDENDALLRFEDVKVPWERVFEHRDTDMRRAPFHDTWAHALQNHQAQARLAQKLRFLAGLGRRIAETVGTIGMPPVREALGRLAAQAGAVEAVLRGMEAAGARQGECFVPDRAMMCAALVVTQELYPQVIAALREPAGGGLIVLPSSVADDANPELARIPGTVQPSPAASPEERVRFLKLAWDAIGSEFASRHLQYEMFYAGAAFVTRGHAFRTYDWARAGAMVEGLLGPAPQPGAAERAA